MAGGDVERQKRAAARAALMTVHKGRVGDSELDLTPMRGAEAISLATRLTIESFGMAEQASTRSAGDRAVVRFVPRKRP